MFGSTYLGRALGVNLYVHGTFWLLPLFALFSGLLTHGPETAALDVAVILTLFGCVALHELGHATAAKLFGIRTRDIVLYPIGGVARLERMPRRPIQEIVVALAGPAVNVAIALFLAPLMVLDGYSLNPAGPFETPFEVFWNRVLWGNIGLVLFNLLPAFPMDGGRVLRAVLAMFTHRLTATTIAANVGAGFAVLFGLAGLGVIGDSFSPMFVILAAFLFLAGRAELNAVRYEDEERESRRRYEFGDPEPRVRVFDVPISPSARPAVELVNGWVYDAGTRMWVEYHNGIPVRRVPPV